MLSRGLPSSINPQRLNFPGSIPGIGGVRRLERNIQKVVLGEDVMVTWYAGFYPNPHNDEKPLEAEMLFVCEHCMKYTEDARYMFKHMQLCPLRTEFPGDLAYSDGAYHIYRIDGAMLHVGIHITPFGFPKENALTSPLCQEFAQMLSLFGRLFIDSKSICYDVSYYYFFVLVEDMPESGNRVLGFFSKEKVSWDNNNLACILVFPNHQRKGLGHLLVSFSYSLSKLDGEIAGPEKPLSTLGKKCYMAYWQNEVACQIRDMSPNKAIKIEDISTETSINREDVLDALMAMKAVIRNRNKQLIIARKEVENWVKENRVLLGKYRLKHEIDEKFARRNSIERPGSSGSDGSIAASTIIGSEIENRGGYESESKSENERERMNGSESDSINGSENESRSQNRSRSGSENLRLSSRECIPASSG